MGTRVRDGGIHESARVPGPDRRPGTRRPARQLAIAIEVGRGVMPSAPCAHWTDHRRRGRRGGHASRSGSGAGGPDRDAEHVGDLGEGQAGVMLEHEDGALLRLEAGEARAT
jgi:hypothetical protein